jgi:glycosyltransferase involved in cell wall biosynthesis
MEDIHVCLIRTASGGQNGSMPHYAALVSGALPCAGAVQVSCINLALPQHLLAKVPDRFKMWAHHAWILLTAPFRLLCNRQADVFHVLDGSHAYVARFLPAARTVVTAHDIIPFLQICGQFEGKGPGALSRTIIRQSIRGLRRAGHVICDSASTLEDLYEHAGIAKEKMSVVYPALGCEVYESAQLWPERRARTAPYLFHIGHNGFYKNREGVMHIFAEIAKEVPDIKLIMAGPPPTDELISLADEAGISGRLQFIHNPDDAQVAELYRNACLLLFPSRYEGFGWPPLEAMASGCPVICSTAGSLAEVVGDAALLADVEDQDAFVSHAIKLLQQQELAEELIQRGYKRIECFQPAKMARKLIELYKKACQ